MEPTTPEILERMEKMLECPICLSQFDNPKVLPCQHTFCKACMSDLVNDAKIKCPSCRRKHNVPENDIEGYPPNITITALIDLQDASRRKLGKTLSSANVDKEIENLEKSVKVLKGIAEISEEKEALETRRDCIKQQITKSFGKYKQTLKDREIKLKEKVDKIANTALEEYTEWELRVDAELNKAECALETIKAENQGTEEVSADALRISSKSSDKLLELAKSQPTLPEFNYTFGSQSLMRNITDLGTVNFHLPVEINMQRRVSQLHPVPSCHPISVDYYPPHKPKCTKAIPKLGEHDFSPFGLAVAPNGNIITTDIENHNIHVFDVNLELVDTFGKLGEGDGELNRPTGVAVNRCCRIVVADQINNRIQIFSMTGNYIHQFGQKGDGLGQLIYPCGLAIDSRNKIYVCDSGNFRIQVFEEDGKPLFVYGDRELFVNKPMFLAVTVDAKVLVCDSKQYIRVFRGQNEVHKLYMSEPTGLAVDGLGNIVVGHGSGHVVVLRENGEALCNIGTCGKGPGQFILPRAIAIAEDGKIIVADGGAKRIQLLAVDFTLPASQ